MTARTLGTGVVAEATEGSKEQGSADDKGMTTRDGTVGTSPVGAAQAAAAFSLTKPVALVTDCSLLP